MEKIYDVLVVGAGPAGSTSAAELSKAGCRVLLLDKKKFPREKTCGGLVPVKALKELGYDYTEAYIKNRIFSLTVFNHKKEYSTYSSQDLLGITTERGDFDLYLVKKAVSLGTEFIDGVSFKGLERENGTIRVYTTKGVFYARRVIGCDGVFSAVRKHIGKPENLNHLKMGFAICTTMENNKYENESEFKLYQLPILYSMGWGIPCGDKINLGVGGPWINKNNIIKGFYRLNDDLNNKPQRVRGAFLPAGGFRRVTYDKGVLLAGDAAGYVDALTGEGLYYAIKSGKIAAKKIIQDELNTYEGTCHHEFQPHLQKSLVKNVLGINKLYDKIPALREKLCREYSQTMH